MPYLWDRAKALQYNNSEAKECLLLLKMYTDSMVQALSQKDNKFSETMEDYFA